MISKVQTDMCRALCYVCCQAGEAGVSSDGVWSAQVVCPPAHELQSVPDVKSLIVGYVLENSKSLCSLEFGYPLELYFHKKLCF